MRRALAALACATVLAGAGPGRAQTAGCREALAKVTDAMERDERRTRTWRWAWIGIGSGLTVGQAVLAGVVKDDRLRLDFAVGAATALVIPGSLLVHPPRVLSDAPLLRDRLALTAMPDGPGDACLALPRAQELLARDATDEAITGGWPAHTLVIGGNVAIGLLLGFLANDWLGAAKQIVGGIAVGETEILTFPGVSLEARGLGLAGRF